MICHTVRTHRPQVVEAILPGDLVCELPWVRVGCVPLDQDVELVGHHLLTGLDHAGGGRQQQRRQQGRAGGDPAVMVVHPSSWKQCWGWTGLQHLKVEGWGVLALTMVKGRARRCHFSVFFLFQRMCVRMMGGKYSWLGSSYVAFPLFVCNIAGGECFLFPFGCSWNSYVSVFRAFLVLFSGSFLFFFLFLFFLFFLSWFFSYLAILAFYFFLDFKTEGLQNEVLWSCLFVSELNDTAEFVKKGVFLLFFSGACLMLSFFPDSNPDCRPST